MRLLSFVLVALVLASVLSLLMGTPDALVGAALYIVTFIVGLVFIIEVLWHIYQKAREVKTEPPVDPARLDRVRALGVAVQREGGP